MSNEMNDWDILDTFTDEEWAEYDQWLTEEDQAQREHDEYVDSMEYWNPIEQGMYDDDPSPYAGDYSEM